MKKRRIIGTINYSLLVAYSRIRESCHLTKQLRRAFNMCIAKAAPVPSPSLIERSSSGFSPVKSMKAVCPRSAELMSIE